MKIVYKYQLVYHRYTGDIWFDVYEICSKSLHIFPAFQTNGGRVCVNRNEGCDCQSHAVTWKPGNTTCSSVTYSYIVIVYDYYSVINYIDGECWWSTIPGILMKGNMAWRCVSNGKSPPVLNNKSLNCLNYCSLLTTGIIRIIVPIAVSFVITIELMTCQSI